MLTATISIVQNIAQKVSSEKLNVSHLKRRFHSKMIKVPGLDWRNLLLMYTMATDHPLVDITISISGLAKDKRLNFFAFHT